MYFPKYMALVAFLLVFTSLFAQTPSAFIHLDQFGYLPNASKVAVISNPQIGYNASESFSPSSQLELKDASTNATVWSGIPQVWNSGATHGQSGDQGWWVDFSSFTSAGLYYLLDPDSGERSAVFQIADNVYDDLMADAGRAFFYNRCNAPKDAPYAEANWVDGNNFLNVLQDSDCSALSDPENAAMRRDLSGGWFDAGDYNKYVTFAMSAVNDLLWAYSESPAAFGDNWNIPESANGLPDIIDELKWELDWLQKMTNPDGSVIIKMGSISYNDNAAAPPSANSDRRYYGPTCTSASISAAIMFAQAAEVFAQFPSLQTYANELETKAINCFAYWKNAADANAVEIDCDDGTIKSGDADRNETIQWREAITAAVHLFALTDDSQYNSFLVSNSWRITEITDTYWDGNRMPLNSALLYYTELAGADNDLKDQLLNSINTTVSNNWNNFYGMSDADLYRGFVPDWVYNWGSNSSKSSYANFNNLLVKHGIQAGSAASFEELSAGIMHSMHGLNPQGLVYLSGMEGRGADRGILEIYHTWFNNGTDWDNSETSLYGPAPGFLVGGPNGSFTLGSISPPANQPLQKSYKDWNTGWNGSANENSWEISEPAIYYQAAYIRNLAAQMSNQTLLPVVYTSPFLGRAREKDVLLSWEVELEENASHYEIEHLAINNRWETIGRVRAQGLNRYQFVHTDPINGPNSYRLKQLDLDGVFSYSNTVTVQFQDLYSLITIYPNPVAGNLLHLQELPLGGILRIYNTQGRPIRSLAVNAANVQIDLSELPKAWYGIELLQAGQGSIWSARFLRQ